jgi:hypothetical protein
MKRIFIQVPIDERTKKAFSMWCEVNETTMAEKIKELIAPMAQEGEAMLNRAKGGDRPS